MRFAVRVLSSCMAVAVAGAALAADDPAPPPAQTIPLDPADIRWGSELWKAPLAEDLDENLKIAGLARVWMEVKLNFPFFAKVPALDWDAEFGAALAAVRNSTSSYDYYREMQRLMARLQDGHSGVYLPADLREQHESMPPIEIEFIEGRAFVAWTGAGIDPSDLPRGAEILRVDGVSVQAYARTHRAPFVSSNSPQHRDVMVYERGLLAGRRGSSVQLGLRHGGRDWTHVVVRSGLEFEAPKDAVEYRSLSPDIGYIAIHSFQDADVRDAFVQALQALGERRKVVIDVRRNSGGSGAAAYDVIAHLVCEPFATPAWKSRAYVGTLRAWGGPGHWYMPTPADWEAPRAPTFTGDLVLLIGPRSLSATDVFAQVLQRLQRGALIGEATGGSTGDPLQFLLPGGAIGSVATSSDVDGGLVGRGVLPDIPVPRRVDDLVVHRDAALAKAIEVLEAAPRPDAGASGCDASEAAGSRPTTE